MTQTFSVQVTWRDGWDAFHPARDALALKITAAQHMHDLLAAKDSTATAGGPVLQAVVLQTPTGPGWEVAVLGRGEMVAVRSDVLVSAYAPAATDDQLKTLTALALAAP